MASKAGSESLHNLKYAYQLYSREGASWTASKFEPTDPWRAHHDDTLRCSHCGYLREPFKSNPNPVDCEVTGEFEGLFQGLFLCGMNLVRNDFRDAVGDLIPYAVWGRCIDARTGRALGYSTLQIPAGMCVYPHRGGNRAKQSVQHKQCPGCGNIFSSGGTKEAIVRRAIGGKTLWASTTSGSLFAYGNVVEERDLLKRFSDLRLFRIPIIEDSKDGWTLPGDPGWDGMTHPTFR